MVYDQSLAEFSTGFSRTSSRSQTFSNSENQLNWLKFIADKEVRPAENAGLVRSSKKMKKWQRTQVFFALSLILHGVVAGVLLLSPHFSSSPMQKFKRVEVELLDPKELLKILQAAKNNDLTKENEEHKKNLTPQGQIVEQSETAINDELDQGAKFLSRHNQKVEQQTQAAARGKFNNTAGGPTIQKRVSKQAHGTEQAAKMAQNHTAISSPPQQTEQKAPPPNASPSVLTADNGDVGTKANKPTMKDLTPSFRRSPPMPQNIGTALGREVEGDTTDSEASLMPQADGSGVAATDDHLKDIKTGMQTLLSTREFVYYSYYNRIKDKLRQYWEPKIKEKMERILREGRAIASNTDRITRIVIILDHAGTLMRVQVVGPSGLNDLDDAAIEAFRAAAPFPNPPKGIADPDGTIKIRWDFILEANAHNLNHATQWAQRSD